MFFSLWAALSVCQQKRNWPWILIICSDWVSLMKLATPLQFGRSFPSSKPLVLRCLTCTVLFSLLLVWLPWTSNLTAQWCLYPIQLEGPARDHSSPSSQALDAHTDFTDIPVVFVFRISNFFIIFFRFGLDFFLYSFLPWGCVFHLSICLQPLFEFSGKYSLNFCCIVFFLSQ